ncbi:hypothetical protein M569_12247 [Genlisea aurea]|uniref:Uncharacterized protein n=1 Tax=Genlisea aurea TaxID=192259 RepID=S8C6Y8_9LAMI|nr:hypothetical protein M569_12247 [Genlisea aurea]
MDNPTADNNIQPFFILHRAPQPRKAAVQKIRRKIDLSLKTCGGPAEDYEDDLRLQTFTSLWSKTESLIKDVLKDLNGDVFAEISKWVQKSFDAIRAWGKKLDFDKATCPFPVLFPADVTDVATRQIFTALLFTRNIDSVDDASTFEDLGVHLRSSSCNVAILSSLDFSADVGIGGCLKALFRQFMNVPPHMSLLASWEWVIKLPIILIFGVATSMEFIEGILTSNTCLHLSISEFTLRSPAERMDAVMETVLLNCCESFIIGNRMCSFLRDQFSKHDGTLTLFIRALKIAMIQHVCTEPSSVAAASTECIGSEVKRLCKLWSSMFMCLKDVGKHRETTLLNIYCEILGSPCGHGTTVSVQSDQIFNQLKNNEGGYLTWALKFIRDLPAVKLSNLLERWETLTVETAEKVKELQQLSAKEVVDDPSNTKKLAARNHRTTKKTENVNEKVAAFLQWMVRSGDFLQCMDSIEQMSRNGILFFNDVDKLKTALAGDPRRRIQADLLESNTFLKLSSSCINGGALVPSMHNTSIMYCLAQEHGDLVNLHEWFHSFKAVVSSSPSSPPSSKGKKNSRTSPSPRKKQKRSGESKKKTDAAIQAVTELQIAGLLRLPTRRRPDFVQRAAFGL